MTSTAGLNLATAPANCLIIGCGYVGTALAIELLADGHKVWGLRRHPSQLPKAVTPIACDLANLATLRLNFEPDYIFYMPSAGAYEIDLYHLAYVQGLKNLLLCLKNNQTLPKRLFYISSTSVYGQTNGAWVDETTLAVPSGAHAQQLLEGENLVQQATDFAHTIVRFAGIYGPQREYFIEQIKTNKMHLSSETIFTNRIHRDDCVGMLRFLMCYSKPDSMYIGVDSDPAPKNEVIAWLAEKLCCSLPSVSKEASIPEQRMRGNKRCSNRRLLASGYQLRMPTFREGYAAVLAKSIAH